MEINEKVITGSWDGLPIWRRRTAEEVLLDELRKNDEARKKAREAAKTANPTTHEER